MPLCFLRKYFFPFSLFFFFIDNAIEAIDEFAFLEGNVIFYIHIQVY